METSDIENRLAGCRPRLANEERDRLFFQAAQAGERKRLLKQTVSYSVLSSVLSAAACIVVMTFNIGPPSGGNQLAGLEPSTPTRKPAVETIDRGNHQFELESQLEISIRPRGVLTAASWSRWEDIEKQSLASLDVPTDWSPSQDAAETKPLAVRSKVTSL